MKSIRWGTDAIQAAVSGAGKCVDAVKSTFGPKGRNVIFEPPLDVPRLTNQGSEITKDLKLTNPFENVGVQVVQQAVDIINTQEGDGGTVAAILLQGILEEGFKNIEAGANPMVLKRGLIKACDAALKDADARKKSLSDKDILNIATSACDGDPELGALMADVMQKIGFNGIVQVEDSQQVNTSVECTSGMMYDKGFVTSEFINDEKTKSVILEKPYVLLYEGDLTDFNDIRHLLELCARQKEPLLILAKEVKGEALRGLVINARRKVVKVAAVSSPGFGKRRERNFQALSVLFRCPVFNEGNGLPLRECGLEICGRIEKAVITKDRTTLTGLPGAASPEAEALRRKYQALRSNAKEDFRKDEFEETLSFLSGGMALIRAGGVSEMEMFTRKNKIQNAAKALQSAREGGILPGGGVAYLQLMDAVDELAATLSGDEKTGALMLKAALTAPLRQMAQNAGLDGAALIAEILRYDSDNMGYDFERMQITDVLEAGIVDSANLIKLAVEVAVSSAGILLTTGATAIGEEPKTFQTQKKD